ncbi:MAG: 4-hydroxythreonine-4-phosphate dehydrogenase PdxA [Chitinophagales bacterium]|nr:4-hydroxythreonine-4-phosphate dehydrogenase PdxA [Chitinophagales bacterium]MDW8418414.1 4-hydroxythreonine-4-phosphate dehydrogenase PdxA [Chitinophagales bacterium]
MSAKPTVGITIGDFNGIGPEVIIKALQDDRLHRYAHFIIYGQRNVLSYYAKQLKIQNFQLNELKEGAPLHQKIPNVWNCWTEHVHIQPGVATDEAGARALLCLQTAVKHLTEGKINVLVTGPVNKHTVAKHQPDFTGQTEFIARAAGSTQSLMLLVSDELRVGLVTQHVSIKEVADKIDAPLLYQKIEMFHSSLRTDFLIHKPRIAVLGLNPHAGDHALIGKEERDVIAPVVNKLKERGLYVFGPYSADGFFGSGHYRQFDGVLAMYHDQGLIPFKTISFGQGVNFTAGIPVIRTSPDHGTGYDIAGKDLASPESLRNAIFTGLDILRNRQEYKEMTANPVERVQVERE